MGARRCIFALLLLFVPSQAWAHIHIKAAYAGYSGNTGGSNLPGFQISVEEMLPKTDCGEDGQHRYKRTGPWSIFEDVGANWGDHEQGRRTQVALMVGARYNFVFWKRGKAHPFEPFVHLPLAFVYTEDSPVITDWAYGLGLGAGLRYCTDNACLRTQFDYVRLAWSEGFAKEYWRYSIGLEVRFGERKNGNANGSRQQE
jgi:hypothetical protein